MKQPPTICRTDALRVDMVIEKTQMSNCVLGAVATEPATESMKARMDVN